MMDRPLSHKSSIQLINGETALILALTLSVWSISLFVRYSAIPEWDGFAILITGFPPLVLLWAFCHLLRQKPIWLLIVLGPIASLVAELLHMETLSLLLSGTLSWHSTDFRFPSYVFSVYLWSLFYFTWYLGYFAIVNYVRFTREKDTARQARTNADIAVLEMLNYQINPHFLFNTLNSISALVLDHENQKAETMVGSLSRFLRFSLGSSTDVLIRLEEEISILNEYLAIEQIRFSEKLRIEYNLSPHALECLVPTLILQPAIENAIKHAITPKKSGGLISIQAMVQAGQLHIKIEDNGTGIQNDKPQTGVGLNNMRERLFILYDKKASLNLENTPNGLTVHMSLPAQTHSQIPLRIN